MAFAPAKSKTKEPATRAAVTHGQMSTQVASSGASKATVMSSAAVSSASVRATGLAAASSSSSASSSSRVAPQCHVLLDLPSLVSLGQSSSPPFVVDLQRLAAALPRVAESMRSAQFPTEASEGGRFLTHNKDQLALFWRPAQDDAHRWMLKTAVEPTNKQYSSKPTRGALSPSEELLQHARQLLQRLTDNVAVLDLFVVVAPDVSLSDFSTAARDVSLRLHVPICVWLVCGRRTRVSLANIEAVGGRIITLADVEQVEPSVKRLDWNDQMGNDTLQQQKQQQQRQTGTAMQNNAVPNGNSGSSSASSSAASASAVSRPSPEIVVGAHEWFCVHCEVLNLDVLPYCELCDQARSVVGGLPPKASAAPQPIATTMPVSAAMRVKYEEARAVAAAHHIPFTATLEQWALSLPAVGVAQQQPREQDPNFQLAPPPPLGKDQWRCELCGAANHAVMKECEQCCYGHRPVHASADRDQANPPSPRRARDAAAAAGAGGAAAGTAPAAPAPRQPPPAAAEISDSSSDDEEPEWQCSAKHRNEGRKTKCTVCKEKKKKGNKGFLTWAKGKLGV